MTRLRRAAFLVGAIVVAMAIAVAVPAGAASAIVGGKPANQTTTGWVVKIAEDLGHGERGDCSGSLIAPEFVLTAAHCIDTYRLSAWTVTMNYGTPAKDSYGVKKIIPYSQEAGANPGRSVDDLALIQLDRFASESPASLDMYPDNRMKSLLDSKATVVELGYGRFRKPWPIGDPRRQTSYSLKQAGQQIIGIRSTQPLFETASSGPSSGAASGRCAQGDSGGPLVLRNGSDTVIGVLSLVGSKGCWYTAVDTDSPYRQWIGSITSY